tara:strand:+ start:31794 stop:32240 length:447 start_codon:yes stop_codon:yes gene_type:complete
MKIHTVCILLLIVSKGIYAQDLTIDEWNNFKSNINYTPPIIAGCNSKKSTDEINSCLTKKFQKRLNRKLRIDVFNSNNLEIGQHTINVFFKISNKGRIVDVKVRNGNLKIVNEITRAFKSFGRIKPGKIDGKPVGVYFKVPIYVEIHK